jgi:hypothetical protein
VIILFEAGKSSEKAGRKRKAGEVQEVSDALSSSMKVLRATTVLKEPLAL